MWGLHIYIYILKYYIILQNTVLSLLTLDSCVCVLCLIGYIIWDFLMYAFRAYISKTFYESFYEKLKKLTKSL